MIERGAVGSRALRVIRSPRTRVFVLYFLAPLLSGVLSSAGLVRNAAAATPENAHPKSYGTGWECNPGYREANGACGAVEVPANAYPTNDSYGRGWECARGYEREGDACTLISIPSNAYLNARGDGWKCDRGYRPSSGACVAVNVPKDAHLDYSGNDWECNRPYERQQNRCALP